MHCSGHRLAYGFIIPTTMSFLQNTTLLQGTSHRNKSAYARPVALQGKQHDEERSLRSKGSVAALLQLARDPVGSVGDIVEGWRDGLTKEERASRQARADKKQLLYLKMRNVGRHVSSQRLEEVS